MGGVPHDCRCGSVPARGHGCEPLLPHSLDGCSGQHQALVRDTLKLCRKRARRRTEVIGTQKKKKPRPRCTTKCSSILATPDGAERGADNEVAPPSFIRVHKHAARSTPTPSTASAERRTITLFQRRKDLLGRLCDIPVGNGKRRDGDHGVSGKQKGTPKTKHRGRNAARSGSG